MSEGLKKYLRYTSWPIIAAMITLMIFGVLAIRAAEKGVKRLLQDAAKLGPEIRSEGVQKVANAPDGAIQL